MKYVYIKTEPRVYTVGFYTPDGKWEPESDWNKRENAAQRVSYLNGGAAESPKEENENLPSL